MQPAHTLLASLLASSLLFATARPDEPAAAGDKIWLDDLHGWLYQRAQSAVTWLDTRFTPAEEQVPTPPSRFRLGVFSGVELESRGSIRVEPLADFESEIGLPNLEKRLSVFLSTKDPNQLPGASVLESDNAFRLGLNREWMRHIKSSAGIRMKWEPEPFVSLRWARPFGLGPHWKGYPLAKGFWENEDGFGGLGSAILERWRDRWVFRQTLSLRWTQQLRDDDRDRLEDLREEGRDDADGDGYRWEYITNFGYILKLLDEHDYGRLVTGGDVADGTGLRLLLSGDAESANDIRFTLYRKAPLYKDFLYGIIAPEIRWDEDDDWKESYTLHLGLEMIWW